MRYSLRTLLLLVCATAIFTFFFRLGFKVQFWILLILTSALGASLGRGHFLKSVVLGAISAVVGIWTFLASHWALTQFLGYGPFEYPPVLPATFGAAAIGAIIAIAFCGFKDIDWKPPYAKEFRFQTKLVSGCIGVAALPLLLMSLFNDPFAEQTSQTLLDRLYSAALLTLTMAIGAIIGAFLGALCLRLIEKLSASTNSTIETEDNPFQDKA